MWMMRRVRLIEIAAFRTELRFIGDRHPMRDPTVMLIPPVGPALPAARRRSFAPDDRHHLGKATRAL